VAQNAPVIMRDVQQTTNDLAAVSRQAREIVTPERARRIDHLVDNADQALQNLARASARVEALAEGSGQDLKVAARELRISAENFSRHSESLSQNLDATARNLQEFSRQVRQNPGLLLRGGVAADDVNAAGAAKQ
jgi:phospholipid/cholesterol/gamma-HCH transport system substrate-binding protein